MAQTARAVATCQSKLCDPKKKEKKEKRYHKLSQPSRATVPQTSTGHMPTPNTPHPQRPHAQTTHPTPPYPAASIPAAASRTISPNRPTTSATSKTTSIPTSTYPTTTSTPQTSHWLFHHGARPRRGHAQEWKLGTVMELLNSRRRLEKC